MRPVRPTAVLATAAVLLGISACAATAGSEPQLSVAWQRSCRPEDPAQSFFRVTFFSEGRAVYEGMEGVKEIGIRERQVTAATASGLVKSYRLLTEAALVAQAHEEGALHSWSTACIRVTSDSHPEGVLISLDTKEGKQLEQYLADAVNLPMLVCPARDSVLRGTQHCGRAVIQYSYIQDACAVPEITAIYSDGQVHLYARNPGGDRYATLDSRLLPQIVDSLTSLPAEELLIVPRRAAETDRAQAEGQRSFSLYGDAALDARRRLADATAVKVSAAAKSDTCVQGISKFPFGQLVMDRGLMRH